MKKLGGNDIFVFLILIVLFSCIGCVTIKERPPTDGLTKLKIQQGWGRGPDRVYKNPAKLKYGADEVWIYEYPSSDQDRFYFKDDILIREEEVASGTF